MKKIVLSIGILTCSSIMPAQQVTSASNQMLEVKNFHKQSKGANLTIVIVEGRVLLQESDEGREIENKLKTVQQQLETDIKNIATKIQTEVTALTSKAKLIDAEMLEREQDKIMKLKKEHELKVNQAQEEFQRKVNIELGKFQKKVQETIRDIAIKNGWDVVIMKESGEVIYYSEKADATSEVLQLLNKKFSDAKPKLAPTGTPAAATVTKK